MSRTTFVADPGAPWNNAPRLPPDPTRDVNPLALMSPFGTLIVEVVPSGPPPGPRISQPLPVGSTATAPPVIATASSGTAPRPLAWNPRGTLLVKGPLNPFAERVSRTLDESIPK